jgi:hypothetical protein
VFSPAVGRNRCKLFREPFRFCDDFVFGPLSLCLAEDFRSRQSDRTWHRSSECNRSRTTSPHCVSYFYGTDSALPLANPKSV